MRSTPVLVAGTLFLAGFAVAADSFRNVEYISGRAGLEKKVKGQLTIDETEVRFTDEKGKHLLSIPMAEIDKAEAGTQREEGSFGRKMALGIFASKTEEYLHVESHNDAGAEAVVFKVKRNTGPGMATKIMFWAARPRRRRSTTLRRRHPLRRHRRSSHRLRRPSGRAGRPGSRRRRTTPHGAGGVAFCR